MVFSVICLIVVFVFWNISERKMRSIVADKDERIRVLEKQVQEYETIFNENILGR